MLTFKAIKEHLHGSKRGACTAHKSLYSDADRVERCARLRLQRHSWYSGESSASLALALSPLLPWQHIFCMEIASLAVPTTGGEEREKKGGTVRDLSRADLSSEI